MIFLREVPPDVVEGVVSGAYKVTGSVVRDVASGRGVAFLQETRLMSSLLDSAFRGASATLQNGLNPLGMITAIQNQQIKSRLMEMQSSLALLQNMQIGTLAVSGLGLGVSAAGFAVMLKRLKNIETHLNAIESKIERVTFDRRSDEIRLTLADVQTNLEAVDTLAARANRVATAESAERALATSAGRLESRFQQQADAAQSGDLSQEQLEFLWTIAAAIRLCHEAGLRALFSIDELQAARELATRRAERFLDLTQPLSPDSLARISASDAGTFEALAEARLSLLPQAEALVTGLRNTVASVASQGELADMLLDRQISGATYFQVLDEEEEAPVLALGA